ncbi:hypothetical protein XELAEV_18000319mg [Xenopus laevis]|uniref:Helix-turn-helix domain-containing protein n=1 Tax=Xenopus laevis TaxID=8355 RepID=A0A974BQE0_XENLA|nr:hypothetical protein XELAEV_18000319mg [Xenopus laevis]
MLIDYKKEKLTDMKQKIKQHQTKLIEYEKGDEYNEVEQMVKKRVKKEEDETVLQKTRKFKEESIPKQVSFSSFETEGVDSEDNFLVAPLLSLSLSIRRIIVKAKCGKSFQKENQIIHRKNGEKEGTKSNENSIHRKKENRMRLEIWDLSGEEIHLLSKGLSFCPTYNFDIFTTLLDVNKFVRNIVLKKFYKDRESAEQESSESLNRLGPVKENVPFHVLEMSEVNEKSTPLTFREGVTISNLEMLQAENDEMYLNKELTKIKKQSQFYPVHCRSGAVEVFQDVVELELTRLAKRPLVKRLTSFLQDTKQVIKIFEHLEWKTHYTWAKADVTSLYSCILHDKGLIAINYHLQRYSNYDVHTQNVIMEPIEYLLKDNYFKCNDIYYLQRCGTSMGAKFGPTYAYLYMGWWEEVHIYGGNTQNTRDIVIYMRDIDDLIFVWNGEGVNYQKCIEKLNPNDLPLKFTKSCHPDHVFRGVPKGQFVRLRCNCNTDREFLTQSCKLPDQFIERGYPLQILETAFNEALKKDRNTLLKDGNKVERKTKEREINRFFLTTYSAQYTKIKRIINKHLPILYNDEKLKEILRAPTLGKTLAPCEFKPAKLQTNWLQTRDKPKWLHLYCCRVSRFYTCSRMYKLKTFKSTVTKKVYNINTFINCNTKFVVYLLTCTKFEVQYGIENIVKSSRGGDRMKRLLQTEVKWIFNLETREPKGLNTHRSSNAMKEIPPKRGLECRMERIRIDIGRVTMETSCDRLLKEIIRYTPHASEEVDWINETHQMVGTGRQFAAEGHEGEGEASSTFIPDTTGQLAKRACL